MGRAELLQGVKKSMYGEDKTYTARLESQGELTKIVFTNLNSQNWSWVVKALCWMGSNNVEVHTVDDPTILNPHDAIVKITRTAICGSARRKLLSFPGA